MSGYTAPALYDRVCAAREFTEQEQPVALAACELAVEWLQQNGCVTATPDRDAMRDDCQRYIANRIDDRLYSLAKADECSFFIVPFLVAGVVSAIASFFTNWILHDIFGPKDES
jgi:hypothetical protein